MAKKKIGVGRIGCAVVLLFFLISAVGLYRLHTAQKHLPESFVLKLDIHGNVPEVSDAGYSLPFERKQRKLSLQEVLFLLGNAATDDRVRFVLLDIKGVNMASSAVQQVRQAIEEARKSGRKVHAFLRNAGDKDIWLASSCDSVTAERGSHLFLDGLKAELLFYTGTFEKFGITFQAAQWSEWKSGIEPYTRREASPQYRESVGMLLDKTYAAYTGDVTEMRGIDPVAYGSVINELSVLSPEQAKQYGIVDTVSGHWEYLERIRKTIRPEKGYQKEDDVFVSGERYRNAINWPYETEANERIAIITASGLIVRSSDTILSGSDRNFEEKTLRRSIEAALDDRNVRAIVLRIDSPGGDALAASNMLQMLDSARVKKPIVASMSTVAASGGYMIALAADSIFAEPLTVTGSIGVYALKPEISGLQEKIGLKREVIARGENADAFTLFKPLDEAGMAKFMETTGRIYNDFLGRVAESRKLSPEALKRVAGGRIWTGMAAVENGLVDRVGGIDDAIKAAALLSGMDDGVVPQLQFYPEPQGLMEYLVGQKPGTATRIAFENIASESLAGRSLQMLDLLIRLENEPGGAYRMAMLPFDLRID